MTTETKRQLTVTNLRMPPCRNGFRAGYASALVNGIPKKLYTGQGETTDPVEHALDIQAAFAAGIGEPDEPGQ